MKLITKQTHSHIKVGNDASFFLGRKTYAHNGASKAMKDKNRLVFPRFTVL